MKREIKFRIFNKAIGYFVQSLDSDKAVFYPADLAQYLSSNGIANTSEYVFPQFTGLKDRYGKEIYEGDIVKNDCGEYEVAFNQDYGYWQVGDPDDGFDASSLALNGADKDGGCEIEIIGSIFEKNK